MACTSSVVPVQRSNSCFEPCTILRLTVITIIKLENETYVPHIRFFGSATYHILKLTVFSYVIVKLNVIVRLVIDICPHTTINSHVLDIHESLVTCFLNNTNHSC